MDEVEQVKDDLPPVDLPVEVVPRGVTKVRPVNYKVDRRREYVLVENVKDSKQVWLMPVAEVPGDETFEVLKSDLASCAKPYDFSQILKKEYPSMRDVMDAFWLKGIVTKDDLADTQRVRNALAHIAPSASSFTKYTEEG